ncbi:hypothetical protein HHI36_020564 [Cryptolaemus montrouzieri]|uniref:DNA-directed RNA polymerase I subunit RPA49 n=1 Tax=Cryptolaemus montrouzieri TaxID=559131 RepID=A0ABD2NAL6_9CUCU
MEVEISEVYNEPGENPMIVNFENGKICDGFESELQCEMYKNKSNKKLLAAYTNKMLYLGEIGSEEDLQYNFLVIRNHKSNKVRLVNLDHVSLKPCINRVNGLADSSITNEKITTSELNKQFGSKRTKRNTEQKERLKLDIENVKEQLEQTVSAIKMDESFLNSAKPVESEITYKPPINRDASTIERVYELENLIPENVLQALQVEVDSIVESDDIDSLGLFGFCKENIEVLKETSSDTRRYKIFVYINYLMKFLATPAKNISKKFVVCNTSPEVNAHILDNFSVFSGTNRTRPMSMRDKSICYILVLAMLALNYNLDLELLSKDIKMGIKKLQEISRILGFTTNGPKSVTLKLPLPPPIVTNVRRKK